LTVQIVKDARIQFISSVPAPSFLKGDTLEYILSDLSPGASAIISLQFHLPETPLLNGGDSLQFWHRVLPHTVDSLEYGQWKSTKQLIYEPFNIIKGNVYVDKNTNGIKESDEPFFNFGLVESKGTADSVAGNIINGSFYNRVGKGTYSTFLNPELPFYYDLVVTSRQSTFADYFGVDSFDIAVVPKSGIHDLEVVVLQWVKAKPGFISTYDIGYKNLGTDTVVSGFVRFIKDVRTKYVSAIPEPSSINGDTLIWNIVDLFPLAADDIFLELQNDVPPQLNAGDTLLHTADIFPIVNDSTPENSSFQFKEEVVNSFDPNDKGESHSGRLSKTKKSNTDALFYTIRFQNTGTSPANFVIIRDTLETTLDYNSIRSVNASHPFHFSIDKGNVLKWEFVGINLPDSLHNEKESHGFVAFSICPNKSINVGDTIKNRASIYFDFNSPVVTNTVKTVIMSEEIITIPKPKLGFIQDRACVSDELKRGKLLNPPIAPFVVSITQNGVPLTYNVSDSSFLYSVGFVGTNVISVSYSYNANQSNETFQFNVISIPPTGAIPMRFINKLTAPVLASSYQWFLDGSQISGANDQNIEVTQSGRYSYNYTINGCTSGMSAIFDFTAFSIADPSNSGSLIFISPNPTKGKIFITGLGSHEYTVQVIDLSGALVMEYLKSGTGSSLTLDLTGKTFGIYILRILDNGGKRAIGTKKILLGYW
jgi:uncharacterized repeat protein (TIGR01451 family)